MALKRTSEVPGGGSYFKPDAHKTAVALMFEPKSVERDVPNTYRGVTRNRDEVTCDVTVFATAADLANGKGVELKNTVVTHPGIGNKLKNAIGDQVVSRICKEQFTNGEGWSLEEVDDPTFDKVAAFYEAREEAVKAALASAPGFD